MKPLDGLSQLVRVSTHDYHLYRENRNVERKLDVTQAPHNNSTLTADTVTISAEGKARLEKDTESKTSATLHKVQEALTAGENSETKSVDELIDELKEKIRDVMQQVALLRTKGDEASVEQAKSLEVELSTLNAQLMQLMTQKLESSKSKP
jgi:hypothetical protein